MTNPFDSIEYDEQARAIQMILKSRYESTMTFLNDSLHESREQKLAITNLEQSFLWVGKAIKADQIKRMNKGDKK